MIGIKTIQEGNWSWVRDSETNEIISYQTRAEAEQAAADANYVNYIIERING